MSLVNLTLTVVMDVYDFMCQDTNGYVMSVIVYMYVNVKYYHMIQDGKFTPFSSHFCITFDLSLPLSPSLSPSLSFCTSLPLPSFSLSLSLEQAKSSILPELIELMNDEECCVRVAALETLSDLISFLDEPTLKTQIVPLVKKFCQRAFNSGDNSLTTVVRLLGRLCDLLKGKPPSLVIIMQG